LAQSSYNFIVLYFIKKQLGVGSVTKDGTKGQFFIRDRIKIETVLLPIFDKYPLLTSKSFDYMKFRKALYVLNDKSLTKQDRNVKLLYLKSYELPSNYRSPA